MSGRAESRDQPPLRLAPTAAAADLVAADRRHVWHPYSPPVCHTGPLLIRGGRGAVLTTADGEELLDAISSWWVNLFGHAHPRIGAAITDQAAELEHVLFAGFSHPPAIRLASQLAGWLPGDLNRVFFSDNGSTSVEVALKIAWQYWQHRDQPRRHRIMAFEGGYHGDTVGAMSAGAGSGFFDPWNRQLIPCDLMPWPDTWLGDDGIEAREQAAWQTIDRFLDRHAGEVAALIMEPLVQGAAGMRMCRPEFVARVTTRLQALDIPVIHDEVMTGFGRTGRMFAHDHCRVVPDMICLSKGLTGGFLPMGLTVISDRIADHFDRNQPDEIFCHGHSYTANPLGCAAALATLELLEQESVGGDWARIQSAHRAGLERVIGHRRAVRPRLLGTIAAVELDVPDPGYDSSTGRQLASWFREENRLVRDVLLRPLGNVLYLMPPYCMSDEQLQRCWQAVDEAVQAVA